MRNVTLDIDRLILDGINVPRGEESRLRATIESELARLFGEGASTTRARVISSAVVSLDGGAIRVASPLESEPLARQIATAVYGSLGAVTETKS